MSTIKHDDDPFYYPPEVSTAYPGASATGGECASGQIMLYRDDDWTNPCYIIDINSQTPVSGEVFRFDGTDLQDAATWIAFNLPEGVVCTLFNNVVYNDNPYDFSDADVCVDLIGNGQQQTIDLVEYGARDCLSAGVWRYVDSTQGWFQLFADSYKSGIFNTIFLAEWPTNDVNNINSWWIRDRASYVHCPCLLPPQTLTLADNSDGSGANTTFMAINEYDSYDKENGGPINLADSSLDNKVSSFSYQFLSPVSASVSAMTLHIEAETDRNSSFQTIINGTNDTSEEIIIHQQIAVGETATLSNTTSQAFETNSSITTTFSKSVGNQLAGEVRGTVELSFAVATSESDSETTTSSTTTDLQQRITFRVPAESEYKAFCRVAIGEVPPTTITTTGKYYYSQPIPSATEQSDGTYELEIPITIVYEGEYGANVRFSAESVPIELGFK